MHRDPPPEFNRIAVSQLIEADRKVFSRLIELDVKPRKAADGTFPMDQALTQALESYEVSFSLMHLQSRAAPPPNRPNKRQREESASKGKGKSKWSQPKGKGKHKGSVDCDSESYPRQRGSGAASERRSPLLRFQHSR